MDYFLNRVANAVYDKYHENLIDICIVLPNRRAALFMKKYLSERAGKTIFSPEFLTIEEFITALSDFRIVDNMYLYFLLYDVHKEIEGESSRSFEDFLQTASLMLSDFNEIDTHMVDAQELFGFLSEAKAISRWNLGERELTPFEKDYLKFYRSLNIYYEAFRKKLSDSSIAYPGITYRKVAENIEEMNKDLKWEKVIFAGFNALSTSEEKIIRSIIQSGYGEIYWDSDEYYIQDKRQEAGLFLREYFKSWNLKNLNWINKLISESEREINIIGAPQNISQVKLAGKLLEESEKPGLKQALILADENLLLPVLNSIPDNVEEFNVTMGFPYKYSPAYTFAYYWFSLFDEIDESETSFRIHKNRLLSFLQHPYRKFYLRGSSENWNTILNKITASYRFYYTFEELKAFLSIDLNTEQQETNTNWVAEQLIKIIISISHQLSDQAHAHDDLKLSSQLDVLYLQKLKEIIDSILTYTKRESEEVSLRAFKTIYQRFAFQQSIPFYGEPLQGLQIMGMLESRTLDFDRIILLSVNEGTLPVIKHANSLIPVDIRKKFGLPTQTEKQAIFAYHFYRLLQRSKEVYYIYNTEANELGGGDKSRYLHQLISELNKNNSNTRISEKILSFELPKEKYEGTTILKTREVMEAIVEKGIKGFSPSSISTYINCSLQFYYQYILRLEEIKEAEESIDAAMLGKIMHDSLQMIYTPLKDKVLEPELLSINKDLVKSSLQLSIEKFYPEGEIKYGKNLLILNIAYRMIDKLLRAEKNNILENNIKEKMVLYLEKPLEKEIEIQENGENYRVLIKGIADRIDRAGREIQIIDYKTGFIDQRELNISDWSDIIDNPKNAKALQLLIYSWLFSGDTEDQISAGIISLPKISSGLMKLKYPNKNHTFTAENKITSQELIHTILKSIYSQEEKFEQTDDTERCRYCSFKTLCSR